jgi:nicotinamidase/pyrazinamidase
MKALIIIDMQNDFMPWGALPVAEADKRIPIIAKCLPHFSHVIATFDWHPANHMSFAVNHGKKPGEEIEIHHTKQKLWPVHCVKNSQGSALVPGLDPEKIEKKIYKGTEFKIDSYSAFFDNEKKSATDLHPYLQNSQITDLYFTGVATDYCVKWSVFDAIDLGYETFIIEDACAGITQDGHDAAIKEMKGKGANLIHSDFISSD